MSVDMTFHYIGGEGRSVEEFMASKRPWFVLLSPVRAMVRCEFVEQLLAFLFRVGHLESVLAHIYFSSPARRDTCSAAMHKPQPNAPVSATRAAAPGLGATLAARRLAASVGQAHEVLRL